MPGAIDFDKLREKAREDLGLTEQQRKWKRLKAMQMPPRVRGPVKRRKPAPPCTCTPVKHTAKHHKKSGRCKGKCKCQAGIRVTA